MPSAPGYGRRLLTLKGAGRFPLVLGNNFADVVEAGGPGRSYWQPGNRVFGVLPTGKEGGAMVRTCWPTPGWYGTHRDKARMILIPRAKGVNVS